MKNTELYRQAIAEAKQIRNAAIANAKEALEETLTPHLKEMLANKLREMEEVDKDIDNVSAKASYAQQSALSEEEASEGDEMEYEYEVNEEESLDEMSDEYAEYDSEESDLDGEEMPGEEGEEEEELDIEDMTVEDLTNLIRDIVAQETGEEELGGDKMYAKHPSDNMDGGEEEIDLDELLKELEVEEMNYAAKDKMNYAAKDKMNYAAKDKMKYADKDNKVKEDLARSAAKGASAIGKSVGKAVGKAPEMAKKFSKGLAQAGKAASYAIHREGVGTPTELKEAIRTIKLLSNQLRETNLLNAKLLYLNKIFKANNGLTESQKVNIIASFDNAETVKEVKLVHKTVSESILTTKKVSGRDRLRESKLGGASKATGIPARREEVITEASEAVKRMQKLAGIIK